MAKVSEFSVPFVEMLVGCLPCHVERLEAVDWGIVYVWEGWYFKETTMLVEE